MKPGHIRIGIDRKVYFEYYKLKKPKEKDFLSISKGHESEKERFDKQIWNEAVKEYEASKQLVEVSNIYFVTWQENCPVHWAYKSDNMDLDKKRVKNNQLCKAEVGKTATIVELTKE